MFLAAALKTEENFLVRKWVIKKNCLRCYSIYKPGECDTRRTRNWNMRSDPTSSISIINCSIYAHTHIKSIVMHPHQVSAQSFIESDAHRACIKRGISCGCKVEATFCAIIFRINLYTVEVKSFSILLARNAPRKVKHKEKSESANVISHKARLTSLHSHERVKAEEINPITTLRELRSVFLNRQISNGNLPCCRK